MINDETGMLGCSNVTMLKLQMLSAANDCIALRFANSPDVTNDAAVEIANVADAAGDALQCDDVETANDVNGKCCQR